MTTAVQKKETKGLTIREMIEGDAFKAQIKKALPKHLTPDRFIRIAITAMTRTPKLTQCTQASLFGALLNLSQLGIEPDGRRAHLIPYGQECQLIIDYKGLVELVMRSGLVANIHADIVCENDVFEYNRGIITNHLIDFKQSRGVVYAVYAICRFKDGTEKSEVMTKEEVEAIRTRSPAGKSGPWVTDWNEMAKKTVFRRLSKWLPLSPEYRDALEVDDDKFDAIGATVLPMPEKPVKLFEAKVVEPPETETAGQIVTDRPPKPDELPETETTGSDQVQAPHERTPMLPSGVPAEPEPQEELKLSGNGENKEPRKTKNYKFLEAAGEVKEKIGETEYYRILGIEGYEHADEILKRADQERIFHLLSQLVVQK